MKYGYCANMIATDPRHVGYDQLRLIKEAGYDYAELPIAQLMQLDEPAFQTLALDELRRLRLPCLRCNNLFPAEYRLTGPEADPSAVYAYAEAAFARMARLGAKRVVFGSSGARNYPARFEKQAAMDQIRALLPALGDLAGQRRMDVVIEPLNRAESNLINSVDEALTLALEVDHPHVMVLADSYHMSVEQEPYTDILRAGDRLGHVHLARLLGRSLPVEGDCADHEALFAMLGEIGYDGCVSVEAYAPGCGAGELARALGCLRGMEAAARKTMGQRSDSE